ncbi:taste receptor type 2 member 9-like [Phaenicophaeus curvirostris]|uniref:taste receptor type 2 member 9-like n=1 Tax=Phaenicophaeus curvirostris TaxID=33595 RepID=UPI0037F0B517
MEACYSQAKFNVTSYDVIGLVTISLQAFAGLWINAFIVSVLVIALVRRKCLNSNEKILLFLGCSRFCYFCFVWVRSAILIFNPWLYYTRPVPRFSSAIHSFINFSNLWTSACLSVFYCIKIVNFQHSFFTFLKAKIDRIVTQMLMGSVLLSLIISVVSYKINSDIHCDKTNATTLGNFWRLRVKMDENYVPILSIYGFGFATTFLAVSFSALLLLFSLWRHKRRMQANSVRNISVDAHIKAMKSILSFFFLYSINFICSFLTLVYRSRTDNPMSLLILVFQYVFPSLHSLLLIFSNPKLEKTLLRTLLWVKSKVCRR